MHGVTTKLLFIPNSNLYQFIKRNKVGSNTNNEEQEERRSECNAHRGKLRLYKA